MRKKWTRFFSGIAIVLSFLYLYVPALRAASTPKNRKPEVKKPVVASKKPLNAPKKANVLLNSVQEEDLEENEGDENSLDASFPNYKKPSVASKKPLNAPRKGSVPIKSVGAEDLEENEGDENSLDASFESEMDDAADAEAEPEEVDESSDDGDDEEAAIDEDDDDATDDDKDDDEDDDDDEENDAEEEEDSGDYAPGFQY